MTSVFGEKDCILQDFAQLSDFQALELSKCMCLFLYCCALVRPCSPIFISRSMLQEYDPVRSFVAISGRPCLQLSALCFAFAGQPCSQCFHMNTWKCNILMHLNPFLLRRPAATLTYGGFIWNDRKSNFPGTRAFAVPSSYITPKLSLVFSLVLLY